MSGKNASPKAKPSVDTASASFDLKTATAD